MTNDTKAFAAALDDLRNWQNLLPSDTFDLAIRALQQAADPNLVTVPRKPTREMCVAAWEVQARKNFQHDNVDAVYTAMLTAAAPTDQPTKEAGDE